jgi:hypothetical protein
MKTSMSNVPSSKELTAQSGINYKFFTDKKTCRFVDVPQKFVKGYNATVHSTTGMAPERVTDSNVFAICERMIEKSSRIFIAQPKFRVGQHVCISMEKMKFAKRGEQNYTTEVFRIIKVIRKILDPCTNWKISTRNW